MPFAKKRNLPKVTALKKWMRLATTEEQEKLARDGGTSRGMLYSVSGGFRSYSPVKAAKVAEASKAIVKASQGRLPELYKTDLCEACAQCSYAKRCLRSAAPRRALR